MDKENFPAGSRKLYSWFYGNTAKHTSTNGNTFLGMNLYTQQVTSAIAAVFTAVSVLYVFLQSILREVNNNENQ